MQIEQRGFTVQELRVDKRDDGGPIIRGHAAVFDSLSENLGGFREIIKQGAFTKSIKNDDVRAFWNHNTDIILGRNHADTLRLSEDDKGLAIEIDPPDTQGGRDAVTSLERGDVTQMSFGFSVRTGGQDWGEDDDGDVIRTLTDLRLFEVSPVAFPAYPETDIAVREFQNYFIHSRTIIYGLSVRKRQLDLLELDF